MECSLCFDTLFVHVQSKPPYSFTHCAVSWQRTHPAPGNTKKTAEGNSNSVTCCLDPGAVLKVGAVFPLLLHFEFLWCFLTKQEEASFILRKVVGSVISPNLSSDGKGFFCRLHLKTAHSQSTPPIPKRFQEFWIHVWTFQLDVVTPCDSWKCFHEYLSFLSSKRKKKNLNRERKRLKQIP